MADSGVEGAENSGPGNISSNVGTGPNNAEGLGNLKGEGGCNPDPTAETPSHLGPDVKIPVDPKKEKESQSDKGVGKLPAMPKPER